MSELRQNITNQNWVIIAPERLKGGALRVGVNPPQESYPAYDLGCPFCPDNEERFPCVEIERLAGPNRKRWHVRCIENKYQIFSDHISCPTGPSEFDKDGIYYKFAGCGNHELVIESSDHNKTFATMEWEEVVNVVRIYLSRFNALERNPNNQQTLIFKNHGALSGASQIHPHSQIVSMRVVPNHIRALVNEATRYFDMNGVCVFCKIIRHELENGERLIYQNDRFAAFAPYASAFPYEVEIFPKSHSASFGALNDAEICDFSDCLRRVCRKLYLALSNADYNFFFRNPPYQHSGALYYHWHLKITPKLTTPGGFELGSLMSVNVVTPEDAAKKLRETRE